MDDKDFEHIMILGAVLCYLSGMVWYVMFWVNSEYVRIIKESEL